MADRLSGLPSPVLDNVLSFLPAREMVRTSVLSKVWKNVWRTVPFLDIDRASFSSQDQKFWNFAYFLLLLRDGSSLSKFRVFINYYSNYLSWVNKFALYAVRHNAKVIDLDLAVVNDTNVECDNHLTSHLFECESLKELKLSSTHITIPSSIWLPALRVLHLRKVIFQDDKPSILFSAITALETLILDDCLFHNKELLCLSSHQLATLILKGKLPKSIEINAPSLISIEFGGDILEIIKFTSEVNHLRDANIPLQVSCFHSVIHLFKILHTTQSLTLSCRFILSLAVRLQKDMSILDCIKTSFPNLKWLKLGTSFSDSEMLVINTLLDCSPKIENIVMENEMSDDTSQCSAAEKVWFENKLCHLKSVTIQGFRGCLNEEKFIKLMLENAIVLEKLIIMRSKTSYENNQDMMIIGKKLLAYARASSTVGILFG
ncbi:hypothetical protein ACHQM5_025051 [Ranunculus cassubicifolius]